MKFSTVVSALAVAEAVYAAPRHAEKRRANRAARLEAKRAGNATALPRHSKTMIKSTADHNGTNKNVEYSTNWSGAVLIGENYDEVTAVVTVPTPSAGSSGGFFKRATEYSGSAWVGIDGDTCESAILQTGFDWYYEGGQISYDAWYEWYPDNAYDFDIEISKGDEIKMTVDASSKTAGTATIENLTTGKTVTERFSNEYSGSLCETNAEWIVEDFEECYGNSCSLVDFADFGTLTFSDAYAYSNGKEVGPSNANILYMESETGSLESECSASSSSVTCKYV